MLKKGFKQVESPEKMDIETVGIEMTRNTLSGRKERLTGGNAPADERNSADLVLKFIRQTKG